MKEIVCIEVAPGDFAPKPSRSLRQKMRKREEQRRQKVEEWQLLAAGIALVLACIALGAWQGHLMVSG